MRVSPLATVAPGVYGGGSPCVENEKFIRGNKKPSMRVSPLATVAPGVYGGGSPCVENEKSIYMN